MTASYLPNCHVCGRLLNEKEYWGYINSVEYRAGIGKPRCYPCYQEYTRKEAERIQKKWKEGIIED